NITVGTVVTTLEYEPTAGTKAAKIVSIANDIARVLRAQSVRVIPALAGKNTVGIEIPSEQRRVIRLGDVLKNAKFRSSDMILPVALGVNTLGEPAVEDLVQMPHLLIAGTTGSGKSVFINNLIAGLVCKNTAKQMRFVFIDPKMVELAAYKKLPHLACPVISDIRTDAKTLLNHMVDEMEKRYDSMLALETRNIQEFNEAIRTRSQSEFEKFTGEWQPLPYVVFLIDEFADMVLTLGKEAEELITRLAQKARAAGIHLVIATQRPSVDVVTDLIKANFPTCVAGSCVPAWVRLGVTLQATRVGLDTALGFTALPAALLYLFLLWAVFYRDAPPEPWFASHLVWLSLSFGDFPLAVAVGALFFAVGLLFAAIAPPIVFLIIYGPLVLGTLLIMWFAY